MPEKDRPDHDEDVPVLTEMVEDEGQRRPAVDGPALEALARGPKSTASSRKSWRRT